MGQSVSDLRKVSTQEVYCMWQIISHSNRIHSMLLPPFSLSLLLFPNLFSKHYVLIKSFSLVCCFTNKQISPKYCDSPSSPFLLSDTTKTDVYMAVQINDENQECGVISNASCLVASPFRIICS